MNDGDKMIKSFRLLMWELFCTWGNLSKHSDWKIHAIQSLVYKWMVIRKKNKTK